MIISHMLQTHALTVWLCITV